MVASNASLGKTAPRKRPVKKNSKKKSRTNSHLETLVSQTKKLSVDELLDLYKIYDKLVIDHVFSHLLWPYTRFARTWLRDQVRDLCAGTDRNRLILTSRERKRAEAEYEALEDKSSFTSQMVKPRHDQFIRKMLQCLRDIEMGTVKPEAVTSLGLSRLVMDDMATYVYALSNRYPQHVMEWCSAYADGDIEAMRRADSHLRSTELEVGFKRDHGWYVVVNLQACYDQIEKMVHTVCLGFARLLFRFAHQLRGFTTTEENFSAGYEGLVRAARNYDPVDGSSFTAHCQWWVRSALLQRQRQSSVIVLPTTTWFQLSQLQKGKADFSDERVSSLRERAEMFYANSANASRSASDSEDADIYSFEAVRVTSPDAHIVMGDALHRSQSADDVYEVENLRKVGGSVLNEVVDLLCEEDPTLLFPLLLWSLNSGIDATLLAEVTSSLFLGEEDRLLERQRHEMTKSFQVALETKTTTGFERTD